MWQEVVPNQKQGNMKIYCDSDWAADKKTRKSCSCAVITVSGVVLATFVRGQRVQALSSAEAEFYAAVMGVAEAMHLQQVLGWLGEFHRLEVFSDSSAARSVLSREGVGKIRHLEVKLLWIQSLVKDGRLLVSKVNGNDNVADIGTKPLGPMLFAKHRRSMGLIEGPLPNHSNCAAVFTHLGGGPRLGEEVPKQHLQRA